MVKKQYFLFYFFSWHRRFFAHGVDENTQTFLSGNDKLHLAPFLYIGAKHAYGFDHLLFLVGVIFSSIVLKSAALCKFLLNWS
jgi:hypothetical protein